MVPTLSGRIQTRIFLLAVVGGLITLAITPMLPVVGDTPGVYRTTFLVLAAVTAAGVVWELVYHVAMQFRWEKDWPTIFGLATLVPEGLLIWWLLRMQMVPGITGQVPWQAFAVHFGVVWVAVWLFANGPMRVPFVHWRFRGGRLM